VLASGNIFRNFSVPFISISSKGIFFSL
jgi:hypothetical protein